MNRIQRKINHDDERLQLEIVSTACSLSTHPLASRPSRQKHCTKIITHNMLGTYTSLTWYCMSSTMMLISWYDRPTALQLLMDLWTRRCTHRHRDAWHTDVLTRCPRMCIQTWMMDGHTNECTMHKYTNGCMDVCTDAKWTNWHTDRLPDISRCLTTLHNAPMKCWKFP